MKSGNWAIGIAAGLLTGLAVAGIATFLDWRLNPGGIYHDASGTHWAFVRDTALSWFVPVAAVATVFAWVVLFILSRWR